MLCAKPKAYHQILILHICEVNVNTLEVEVEAVKTWKNIKASESTIII